MTNKEIVRFIKSFRNARDGWLKILVANPDSVEAAQTIASVNSKIEVFKTLWNWHDESVEFPS